MRRAAAGVLLVAAAVTATAVGPAAAAGSVGAADLVPQGYEHAVPRAGWGWPLAPDPEVVRRFEPPAQRWTTGHRGVDLLGAPGQPVLAPHPGTVTFAGTVAGRGVLTVDHGDGLRTTYEPVRALVARGDQVGRGQAVAVLDAGPVGSASGVRPGSGVPPGPAAGSGEGSVTAGGSGAGTAAAGYSPGPAGAVSHCAPRLCLHWGARRGEEYVDPLGLLWRPAPPVLLPWGGHAR